MGVFISRLLPVIRHLIGIPAGIVPPELLAVLDWRRSLGSAIWCSRARAGSASPPGRTQQLMQGSLHRISLWVGGLMLFLGVLYYVFVHRHMRR